MSDDVKSLQEKVRISFEARRNSHAARLSLLRKANIIDTTGNFKKDFFSEETIACQRASNSHR